MLFLFYFLIRHFLNYLDLGFNLASLLLAVAGSTASTRLDFLSLEMDGLALRFLSKNEGDRGEGEEAKNRKLNNKKMMVD